MMKSNNERSPNTYSGRVIGDRHCLCGALETRAGG